MLARNIESLVCPDRGRRESDSHRCAAHQERLKEQARVQYGNRVTNHDRIIYSDREALLGQIAVMLILVIAILLRWVA